MEKKIGHYSFIFGVILAVILGLGIGALRPAEAALTSILVILGLVVGFINVTGKETKEFLLVAIVLILAAYAGSTEALQGVMYIGPFLGGIFKAIMSFVVPATIVVGLKDILELSKNS